MTCPCSVPVPMPVLGCSGRPAQGLGVLDSNSAAAQPAGALAGSAFPLDREQMARELGFSGITANSLDAVSDRDFLLEALAALAILMMHLSRYCEDLIIWSSVEFGFVELDDAYATGSSMMPQKKNPHSLERIKALGGQAVGWLPGIQACQHSVLSTDLDLTYADDLLTGIGDATRQALRLGVETVATLIVHEDRMAETAGAFWSTTSHLADEIVRRYDLPFRAAHHVVGRFVRDSIAAGRTPAEARAEDLAEAGREMAGTEIEIPVEDLREILDARAFLTSRVTAGSVHPDETRAHRAALAEALDGHRGRWKARRDQAESAIAALLRRARELSAR